MDRFHEFLKHPNVVEVAPDPRIIALPTNIRNHYVKKKEAGKTTRVLTTPDAIHLATATHHQVVGVMPPV